MSTSSPPPSSIPPDGDNSPARLLQTALASKARAEEERTRAEARAAAAEALAADLQRQLEEARKGGADGASRQQRALQEELQSARSELDVSMRDIGALRVQLRSQEEKLRAMESVLPATEARAKAAEELARATDDRAKAADERAAAAEDRSKAAEDRAKAAEDRCRTAEDSAATMKGLMDKAQTEAAQQRMLRAQDVAQLETLTAEVDRLRKALQATEGERDAARNEIDGARARAEIAVVDAQRMRPELDRLAADVARLSAALDAEKLARDDAEKTAGEITVLLEQERARMAQEHGVLGQTLMESETAGARTREELVKAQARLAELERGSMSANAGAQAELTRLKTDLEAAEAERRDFAERARKAEREAKLLQIEMEALNTELKTLRGSSPPAPAAGAAAAAAKADHPLADELEKAQKRLVQYGDEIKRLRDELAGAGR